MKIPATYLKLYLEHFSAQPELLGTLLDGTGLDMDVLASSDRYVAFESVAQLLENANRTLEDGWHVRLAAEMEIMQHGPVGIAAATAADLGAAVVTLARYVEVRAPFAWLERGEHDGRAHLRCFETVELGPLRASLLETTVVACANVIRHVGGQRDEGLTLHLPGPPPAYAAAFSAEGFAESKFGAASYGLSFPAVWLSRPSLLYDGTMHAASVNKCRELLATTTRRSDLEFSIREMLHESGGRSPGLEVVAERLNLSPRTLIRRLKEDGTAYQIGRAHV